VRGLADEISVARHGSDSGRHAASHRLYSRSFVDGEPERIVEGIEDNADPDGSGFGSGRAVVDESGFGSGGTLVGGSRFGSGGTLVGGSGFGSKGAPDQKDRRDGRNRDRPNLHPRLLD
jgi:hypothetical protein